MSKSRRVMMWATATGVWMAWRLIGATLVPVSRIELSIAIIALYRPFLDETSWLSLLTLNAVSWGRSFFLAYYGWRDYMVVATDIPGPVYLAYLIFYGLYMFYVWPYIFIHVYKKAGLWKRLGVSYR